MTATPSVGQILACLSMFWTYALAQYYSDQCDWTVWDSTKETKGVRSLLVGCAEGHISWRHPYGAVRITMKLPGTDYRACFKASGFSTAAKISLEVNNNLKPLATINHSSNLMAREICLDSTQHGDIILYVEADADSSKTTLGKLEIDYDLQRIYTRLTYDSMEECRPCTDKELLHAFCSSDFVVKGSIERVQHDHEGEETEIHLRVSKVFRQKTQRFRRSTARRGRYSGSVIAPHKCGISKGDGHFVFMGRIRIGRAFLQCAPRIEEWKELKERAVSLGENLCSLD